MTTNTIKAAKDYLNGLDSAPGRVRTFLESPEKGTTPHSCVLSVYDNNLFKLIKTTALDLKGGAGVKVVLDTFENRLLNSTQWCFTLDSNHTDFNNITQLQQAYLRTCISDIQIKVADSMIGPFDDGSVSIIESWQLFIEALESGKSVSVDLSALRAAGTINDKGLVATGPVGYGSTKDNSSSFWAVYFYIAEHIKKGDIYSLIQLLGCINDTLRRGGFKRGIVCSSLKYTHPNFKEYLECDITKVPGSHKKAARIDNGIVEFPDLIELICTATNNQGIFWERILEDGRFMNVCEGIRIHDRGTCLIWRVNLGKCENADDLVNAFVSATLNLCELHTTWRDSVGVKGESVLALDEDTQIGVDVFGMANALSLWGINYAEFNQSLIDSLTWKQPSNKKSDQFVAALGKAYQESVIVADAYMDSKCLPRLDYIHTVEPAQSHSYEAKDAKGNTLCRGIWPPLARRTQRRSDTQKNVMVKHGKVETISEFGPDFNMELSNNYYNFMVKYSGKVHGVSSDDHMQATPEWFTHWVLDMQTPAKYYTEFNSYNEQQYLRKRALVTNTPEVACSIANPGSCAVCAE